MAEFEGVVSALSQTLSARGYEKLTPVQEAMLDPELAGEDLLVSAQTGSGKTVAFGIALAPTLLGDNGRFERTDAPLALIVAPTRELALQVKREFEWLYAETGAQIASCVGGMDMRTEVRALERGAHIVVGTPGRLCDHIKRGTLKLNHLRAAVLDEADEMLDLGFKEELELILDAAPKERRTLMFSATVSRPIANLAKSYQNDAIRVSAGESDDQHSDIEYRALTVAQPDAENAIINVLRYYDAANAIVFCATRMAVNHLTSRFNNRGFAVVALSGELSQKERTHALQAMRDGRAKVCIATDVAARGIDLPNLELVIHSDIPKNRESLLHRSGRTGRAGRKGVSVLIVPQRAQRRTERLLQGAQIEAEWAAPPSADEILARDDQRILDDPILTNVMTQRESGFVEELLAKHSPEQIAAALVRKFRDGKSAPEDLRSVDKFEKTTSDRTRFDNSIWFSLSTGHKDNAEPRWILPILCRVGQLNRDEIGAIRIQDTESYVEVTNAAADKFIAALGPQMNLEKQIFAKRLDSIPEGAKGPGGRPRGDRKPFPGKGKEHRGQKREKFDPDGGEKALNFRDEKPRRDKPAGDDKPAGKPAGKFGGKPKGKFTKREDWSRDGGAPRSKGPAKGKTGKPKRAKD